MATDYECLGSAQGVWHERRTWLSSESIFNVWKSRNRGHEHGSLTQNTRRRDETSNTPHATLYQRSRSVMSLRKVSGMSDAPEWLRN